MVILDQLAGTRGEARHILGVPSAGGIEWANAAELARLEVVRGIQFDGFTISHAEVRLNFVECSFNRCVLRDLKTEGHLWGAEDHWNECAFKDCHLHGMIAPVNSFKRCRFEGVSVVGFKAHQTLFEGCSFCDSSVEGLKAILVHNSQITNPELRHTNGQILFRDCRFEGVSFRQCYFDGAVFHRCAFVNTDAIGCSFDGVISDVAWWDAQQADPFAVFLGKVLELIRAKCGTDSAAYREFENYIADYGSGKTRDKNFSACLYSDRVPYAETQKIIKDLRKLVAAFPF